MREDNLGLNLSCVEENDSAASRIASSQERRQWVINNLVPLLREIGPTHMVDVAKRMDLSVIKLAGYISSARSYVSTDDSKIVCIDSSRRSRSRTSDRLVLSLNPALME